MVVCRDDGVCGVFVCTKYHIPPPSSSGPAVSYATTIRAQPPPQPCSYWWWCCEGGADGIGKNRLLHTAFCCSYSALSRFDDITNHHQIEITRGDTWLGCCCCQSVVPSAYCTISKSFRILSLLFLGEISICGTQRILCTVLPTQC